jgi:L-ascorbate metabolism protein UlaG (beta-lactamase superfamily)
LGHSCLQIECNGIRILVDPFLTGNPRAATSAENVAADFILVTHGHSDHVGDTLAIAERTGATVVSNFEIVSWVQQQGIAHAHPMQIGGSHLFPFGKLKLTQAFHGSVLPDGTYGGNPAGLHLFLKNGVRIYVSGDTGLFGDMRLIGEDGVDLAVLPIGDNFTMGPDDALRAVKFLQPRWVVPVHYGTWDVIAQNASAWALRVKAETPAEPVILEPGQTFTLPE